jgi:hypothetical protein
LSGEVGLGGKPTDYREIASELSHPLGMKYAFAVEFVEVDGLEPVTRDPIGGHEQSGNTEPPLWLLMPAGSANAIYSSLRGSYRHMSESCDSAFLFNRQQCNVRV